jgi:hypothetical protein
VGSMDLDPVDAHALEERSRLPKPLTHSLHLEIRHLNRRGKHEPVEEHAQRSLSRGVDPNLGRRRRTGEQRRSAQQRRLSTRMGQLNDQWRPIVDRLGVEVSRKRSPGVDLGGGGRVAG